MTAAKPRSNVDQPPSYAALEARRRVPRQMPLRLVIKKPVSATSSQAIAAMLKASSTRPVSAGASLIDTWSGIEDVLLRLSEYVTWHVLQATDDDSIELTATGFDEIEDESMRDVCGAATQPDLYKCRVGEQVQAIVQVVELRDEDLVLTLAPLRVIRRWEEGEELALRIQGFIRRAVAEARERV